MATMNLLLIRETYTDKSTIGSLHLDGVRECYTLEDRIRREKVYGETCIPAGTYPLVWLWSPKRQKFTLYLQNVPGFTHIQIHAGNHPEDTLGCILVGMTKVRDMILHSKVALDELEEKTRQIYPLTIEVRDGTIPEGLLQP